MTAPKRSARSVHVIFRLTPLERKALREEAQAQGLTISELVRKKVLG